MFFDFLSTCKNCPWGGPAWSTSGQVACTCRERNTVTAQALFSVQQQTLTSTLIALLLHEKQVKEPDRATHTNHHTSSAQWGDTCPFNTWMETVHNLNMQHKQSYLLNCCQIQWQVSTLSLNRKCLLEASGENYTRYWKVKKKRAAILQPQFWKSWDDV